MDADPITTEVIRHGLNSAAEQMKRALIRTAFSPVIYEVLDFAVAIYDRRVRLLAQAPALPLFMGTMSFCVEGAVEAVGGEDALEPGDIILYNVPYGTGSHPQDAAVVMPVFLGDEGLIGYTTIKGHWLDIGGKEPYSTDTVDVFQEGTIFPGVKLYKRGELVTDIFRMATANSRVPKMVAGDLNAEVVGVRSRRGGVAARSCERYGLETVRGVASSGCSTTAKRSCEVTSTGSPTARTSGRDSSTTTASPTSPSHSRLSSRSPAPTFASTTRALPTHSQGRSMRPWPRPCRRAGSRSRCSPAAMRRPTRATSGRSEVVVRPGSMFHPLSPSPTFLCTWSALQAIEVIYDAIAKAIPDAVPAWSSSCLCALVWWGIREGTGEPWADGSPHPIGQGAHSRGDGSSLIHVSEAATRFSPVEVWEARNPWLVEQVELAAGLRRPRRVPRRPGREHVVPHP